MMSVGISMPVRVASSVTIAPGFRVQQIWRDYYGTSHLHRGPRNGGHRPMAFGVWADYTFAR